MRYLLSLLIVVSALSVLVGCEGSTPKATAEQTKDFKGGPMPADFQEKLAKEQAGAASKAPATPGAPTK